MLVGSRATGFQPGRPDDSAKVLVIGQDPARAAADTIAAMGSLTPEEAAHLRAEIELRIQRYRQLGLKTERMQTMLDDPIALLERYLTADPDVVAGWKALVKAEPRMTLEWLALNDPAAYRSLSQAAKDAATWKLSKPT